MVLELAARLKEFIDQKKVVLPGVEQKRTEVTMLEHSARGFEEKLAKRG